MIVEIKLDTLSVKVNETTYTAADITEARFDLTFGQPDWCWVALARSASGSKVNLDASVVAPGTSKEEGSGKILPLFSGVVTSVEPVYKGGVRTLKVQAYDWLLGKKLKAVPDPVEMVDYVTTAALTYIDALADYVVRHAVRRKLTYFPEVQRVLREVPGGYGANVKKFEEALDKLSAGLTKDEGHRLINELRTRVRRNSEQAAKQSVTWYYTKYLGLPVPVKLDAIERVYSYARPKDKLA